MSHPSSPEDDSLPLSVLESIHLVCGSFEAAWKSGQSPRIETYVQVGSPDKVSPPLRPLLIELVKIDVEYRWRSTGESRFLEAELPVQADHQSAQGGSVSPLPPRPLLEDYLGRYSQLGRDNQLPDELIAHEYRVRHLWGDQPGHADYLTRFGSERPGLQSLLMQVDGELVSDCTRRDTRPDSDTAPWAQVKAWHVRCPHCHGPVEIAGGALPAEVECSQCGGRFAVARDEPLISHAGPTAPGTLGRKIGRFELVKQVGKGAFGAVWKARDTKLDRFVAVKIPRSGQVEARGAEQFLREARAAAQLKHPNIVHVHEVGRCEDLIYIVSDFISGVTLSDWASGRSLAPLEAAQLCERIAKALHYAHTAGIVHRDLKPSNIMIDQAGEPIIMDFGLAKREVGEITLTLDGQVIGTPAYMSPEQARGEGHRADRRSDIYSMGVILFELLTGEMLFRGNVQMLLKRLLEEEPPSPRKLNPRVPRDLETICLKCLEKSPGSRYGSAEKLAGDLQRFSHDEPIEARPISKLGRGWRWCKRNPRVAGLTAAVLAAMLLGTIASTYFAVKAEMRLAELTAAEGGLSREKSKFAELRHQKVLADRRAEWAQMRADAANKEAREAKARKKQAEEKARKQLDQAEAAKQEAIREADVARTALTRVESERDQAKLIARDSRSALAKERKENEEWRKTTGEQIKGLQGEIDLAHGDRDRAEQRALGAEQRLELVQRRTYNDQLARVQELCLQEPQRARAILEDPRRFPPPLRDFTWGYFHRVTQRLQFQLQPGLVPSGFERDPMLRARRLQFQLPPGLDSLGGLAYSPAGKTLAFASGKLIGLWDAESGKLKFPIESPDVVRWVRFSPGGKTLLSIGGDEVLRFWNSDTGKELSSVRDRSFDSPLLFSPNGKSLAVVTSKSTIRILDAESAQVAGELEGHSGDVHAIAFSPEGNYLASGGEDKTVRIWNLETGKTRAELAGPAARIQALAFSPHGALLASGEQTSYLFATVRLWQLDAETPSQGKVFGEQIVRASRLFFSPNGQELVGIGDGHVSVCDIRYGIVECAFSGPEFSRAVNKRGDPYAPDNVTPDRSAVVLESSPGVLQICDLRTSAVRAALHADSHEGTSSSVTPFVISPDGTTLATLGSDHAIKLWDLESGRLLTSLHDQRASLPMQFSPDAGQLAVAGQGVVRVWLARARVHATLQAAGSGRTAAVAFSPDGKLLATAGDDTTIRLWDAEMRIERRVLRGHGSMVWSLGFSQDGKRIVSGGDDKTVRVWDTQNGKQVLAIEGHSSSVRSVAFSPDGTMIASADLQTGFLWDAQTGHVLNRYEDPTTRAVAFSPDGGVLAVAGNKLRLWDLETGQLLDLLPDGDVSCTVVAFSPNGRWLATAGSDKAVRLWNLEAGVEEVSMEFPGSDVHCLAFSADSETLAVGAESGPIQLRDTWTGELRAALDGFSGHSLRAGPQRLQTGRAVANGSAKDSPSVGATSLAFSPDNTLLASAHMQEAVILWEADKPPRDTDEE